MNTPSKHKKASPLKISLPPYKDDTLVYKGVRFDVHQMSLPGKKNRIVKRDVVVHPGAVLILPLLDEKNIVMIRNYRFAVDKELWELPAGTFEPGEEPIETAKRELLEETGYQAATIEPMTLFLTSPGICNEVMYTFVAKDLTLIGQSLDENEQIIVEIVNWKKAMEMIENRTIIDGKTITALLYYSKFMGES